jgi:hypothetical protein
MKCLLKLYTYKNGVLVFGDRLLTVPGDSGETQKWHP